MATNGWASLGQAFAGGGAGQERAYQAGQTRAAQLATLLAGAQIKRDEAMARDQFQASLADAGYAPEQASVLSNAFRAGFNPTQLSGYRGDMQEQDFRQGAVARSLAGDFGGGNAYLMGVANGPVELAAIQGQNLINNRLLPGGGGVSTTEQGRAGMLADAARARASDASAASSFASAARTRQAMGIDGAQFALQRAGQWNPGGKNAGGTSPLPVGALKELLGVEEALGATQVLGDIIGKNRNRLTNGTLDVGPGARIAGRIRTGLNMSNANDVNITELNADKTKIVNESLRLNKGVQTEGDAIRAGEELMAANDAQTLKRAFDRLEEINQRAIQLQQRKAALINGNYGRSASPGGMPSAVEAFGGGAAPVPVPAVPARRRFNPATGRIE
ncbi:hypothetical protein [Stenotrophomonas geniculata]|uniref:hypothetical protein n=1 Tax=Stenotrophomonas geniculata TaxID=86188 RepID=UPI00247B225B|nr:hypothetical protein [Stenotrophomonas geniculata]MDH7548271.1 hypothetical protein [Stenotrophomonas geniculata]